MNFFFRRVVFAGSALFAVLALAGCAIENHAPQTSAKTAVPARKPYDAALLSKNVAIGEAKARREAQNAATWNYLAGIYLLRQRESGDIADALRAENAARRVLKMQPQNTDALLRHGRALLAQHQFGAALDAANRAAKLDAQAQRLRADVLLELGRYPEAEKAIAIIPSAPHDANATALRARWAELHGRTEEALQLWQNAAREATANPDISHEAAAWFLLKNGNCLAQSGRAAEAEKAYRAALELFPNDYRACAALSRLFARRGEWKSAALWGEKAVAFIPEPEIVALLGDAYAALGQKQKAAEQYDLVETIAQLAKINGVVYDRQRAIYLCDREKNLPEALRLARGEIKLRQDIYTWDALAWALYKNKKYDEAREAAQKALSLGTRDAMLWFHAGMIDLARGDKNGAKAKLSQALEINPQFHAVYAKKARALLGGI